MPFPHPESRIQAQRARSLHSHPYGDGRPASIARFPLKQLVSQIDVAPTLLDACGIRARLIVSGPQCPAATRTGNPEKWPNEVFVQISESMTGRDCAHRNGHMSWHNRMESRALPPLSTRSTSFITYSPIRTSSSTLQGGRSTRGSRACCAASPPKDGRGGRGDS